MATEEYIIQAQDLRKAFYSRQQRRQIQAVKGINLAIRPGETFGLIGPDGAGKTTMMRLLAGLMQPTSGRATVCGYDTTRDAFRIKERVGYMAQQFSLYGDLTVAENLRFFGSVYGVAAATQEKRVPQLLSFAGLERFQARRAAQLSGGMKKKLALACLLIHEPEVALLDEPTLGVDPVSRREFWNLLSALRIERGLTILVCTPYMDEAERCHRVGLILDGELLACDTPANIKAMVSQELIQLCPSHLKKAKEMLQNMEGVLELQTYGNLLHVFLDDADRRQPELERALQAAGIAIEGLRRVQPRMEEAFVSLIGRQRQGR
mgnify:CR=1 FL=1